MSGSEALDTWHPPDRRAPHLGLAVALLAVVAIIGCAWLVASILPVGS